MGTTPRVPALAFVLLYAGTGSACRESDHEPAAVDATSRIDSAGVVIVDHGTVSSAAAGHGWRVDAAPVMTIGSGTAAAHALHRVKAALLLGDSVIVVADGGSQQLRFFDRGGGVFTIAGGKGGGPGEFKGLSSIHRTGEDAIIAFDWKLRKFALYDNKSDFRGSWLIPAHIDGVVVGATAYGDVVTRRRGPPITPSATPYTSQPLRLLLRLSAGVTAVDTIGEFPGPLRYHGPGRAVITVSFTATTEFAVGPDYFVAGYSADPEVRTFDLEGHLRRVVRWPRVKREVLPRHVEAEKDRIAKELNPFGGAAPSWFQQMSAEAATYLSQNLPFPTHFPVYDRLVIDGHGYLWVAPYPRPGERADPWIVFDASGELVGEVSMPDDVVVLDIGVDYVLGLHLDDFDVEYVSLFAIEGRKP